MRRLRAGFTIVGLIFSSGGALSQSIGTAYGVLEVVQDPLKPERPPSFRIRNSDSVREILGCGGVGPAQMVALRGRIVQAYGTLAPAGAGICVKSLTLAPPPISQTTPFKTAVGLSDDRSVIVGDNGDGHGFYYKNGQSTDIGNLGEGGTVVEAVSANGLVIVGASQRNDHNLHAFRFSAGTMSDIGTLGGATSHAMAVSRDGSTVVGGSSTSSGSTHAFIFRNGLMTDLTTDLASNSVATGVSRDGKLVVGYIDSNDGVRTGFLWSEGNRTMLPAKTDPRAVSDDGVVVGCRFDHTFLTGGGRTLTIVRAFRWKSSEISSLGGDWGMNDVNYSSCALAISAYGESIVGQLSPNTTNRTYAFYYTAGQGVFFGGSEEQPSIAKAVSSDGLDVAGSLWRIRGAPVGYLARYCTYNNSCSVPN
jgi:probable HAF family extracellular repeat protein